jgi:hypothetical protein
MDFTDFEKIAKALSIPGWQLSAISHRDVKRQLNISVKNREEFDILCAHEAEHKRLPVFCVIYTMIPPPAKLDNGEELVVVKV